MAFSNGKLSNVITINPGSTVGIITVASSKKVYIRSIAACDVIGAGATAQVFVVQNGGTVGNGTKMFDITLAAKDTALIEPIYPIVLDTDGDKLSVTAIGSTVNILITGDKEA
jgi:hypothetical protein|tara:strand:- start:214 stop:552 length:339 start_codon:yes stop_codon:yes gene_type:complete